MKLFVYEFVTGGGAWHTPGAIDPAGSLLAEGAAMAGAVSADLMEGGHVVVAMLDQRLRGRTKLPCPCEEVASAEAERHVFDRLVREAEATLLIAPEMGGALLARCRRAEWLGGRLVSPDARFVAIAADKQRTAQRLRDAGVRVPEGFRLASPVGHIPASLFPAVLKPCDGAGSWLVCRVADAVELRRQLSRPETQRELTCGNLRIEPFVAGQPASVAVLCGPSGAVPLAPCEQILGDLSYVGGRLPLAVPLADRAKQLALAALAAMPPASGYVGVDLVLGAAADGSQDFVIEINPRLTTSYVGLRAACRQNLASAMLDVAAGRSATLSFRPEALEFRSDGTLSLGTAQAHELAGSGHRRR